MLPVWAQVHAELALLIRGAWALLLLCCGGLGSCRLVAAVAMCRVYYKYVLLDACDWVSGLLLLLLLLQE